MGILILDSLTAGQTREAGTFLLAKSRGLQPLHLCCTAMGEVSECVPLAHREQPAKYCCSVVPGLYGSHHSLGHLKTSSAPAVLFFHAVI